jgi:predicted DNA-binding transcriptional regulator AlpA
MRRGALRRYEPSMKILSHDDLKFTKGIDYSPPQLWRLEKQSRFPRRVRLGANRFGWLESEIDAWLTERVRERGTGPEETKPALINGARALMGSRAEPSDSLDYFPTPPWATRALMERVLPELGIAPSQLGTIWEPACGEGHMAEVLLEYTDTVIASDLFDYGYGQVADFLAAESPAACDVVITNPPFGDRAISFVRAGLELARMGVALFLRLQFLESVERYEKIFRDRPPTLCAVFVERVNLCKGRWDPEGGTATAYCWLIWFKGVTPRSLFWIPPGCRNALTRSDDVERFTSHPVRGPNDGATAGQKEAAA